MEACIGKALYYIYEVPHLICMYKLFPAIGNFRVENACLLIKYSSCYQKIIANEYQYSLQTMHPFAILMLNVLY